ncbi:MAG: hypothetical protein ACRYF4_07525 [Janthinobacterium lividum]
MSSLTNSNPLAGGGLLDDFQPKPKPATDSAHIDSVRTEKVALKQAAQERGFVIDNLTSMVRAKRTSSGKASKSHTLRLYIQDINRFQTWCNDNNYSQARGFELLLDKVL